MPRLCPRLFLCLSLLFLPFAARNMEAQEFDGNVKTVPAQNALPMLAAKPVQDDAAHSVAIRTREFTMDGAKDTGRAPGDTRMGLLLELRRPAAQEKALNDFVTQTGRPDTPLYGKTLTPVEFAQRFGLAGSDLDAVKGWLTAKGFEVGNVDNGRLAIDFKGTAAQVEDAFHTEIRLYKSADGVQHFANATELQVPRQLARVIESIEGAQNFTAMQRPNFDGPVTDFALGTELENKLPAEADASPLPAHLTGEALHDASFTASKVTIGLANGLTTLNVRIGSESRPVTGSLTISSEEHGTVAVIRDITECEPYNSGYGRSCTVDYKAPANGIYTLHADYKGDDFTRRTTQKLTIVANAGTAAATQVATISPIAYVCNKASSATCTSTAVSGTISYVLYWTGTLGQPTGTVAFTLGGSGGYIPGSLTLPAAGATSSSGSCTATGASGATVGTCSYSCTYNATNQADQLVSCSLTDSAMNYVLAASTGGAAVNAAFTDTDGNYANIAAATVTEGYFGTNTPTGTATITTSSTLTAMTYGQTQTEGPLTVQFTPNGGVTYSNYNPGSGSSQVFWELTGPLQLESFLNYSKLIANSEGTTSTVPAAGTTFTTPAVVTPGNYTVTLYYSGNYSNSASAYNSTSLNLSLQVKQAQPTITLATPTAAAAVSQSYGSTTPFNVTAMLGWTGVGAAPTASDVNFSTTAPGGTFGTVSCNTPTLVSGTGNTSLYSSVCTSSYTPSGTANVGSYSFSVSYSGDTNYLSAATSTISNDYTIQQATGSLALTAATPGSTTTGTTSSLLTATMSPAVSGVTVTFTDATTGATKTATTNSSGVATYTVTPAALVVGGLNAFSASVAGTTNYTAATSASTNLYVQGVLYSSTNKHNFSGVITNYPGYADVEGTVDGTKVGGYGVNLYNFTTSAQTLTFNFTNASSGAFNYTTTCGSSLASGASCAYEFYYAPPAGDGCTPGTTCTTDSAGYPQGTYESATWNVSVPNGVLQGIGDPGFDRSGAVTLPGTLAGKAILAVPTLTVTPTTYTFPSQAPGVTSSTLTVVVSNTNGTALPFTYTAPSASQFAVTQNTCASPLAGNSSCNIYLTFSASTPATYTSSLTITPSGASAITVSLSGTVESNSGLSLSSAGHNFGNVTDGTTGTYGFTITNNSGATATLGVAYSSATGYSVTTGCGTTLAAAASCGVTVTFAPTTVGTLTDAITITGSVPILPGGTTASPYSDTVSLTGVGVAGGQFTATSVKHSFGNVPVGDSAGNYGVELSNNTSSAVTLSLGSGFTQGANGFTIVGTSCGASLAVNANCELIFGFTPTATGTVTAAYPITASATLYSGGVAVSPSQISLSGTGQ